MQGATHEKASHENVFWKSEGTGVSKMEIVLLRRSYHRNRRKALERSFMLIGEKTIRNKPED